MGWSEGQGLGKDKHGTVDIIEVNRIKTDRKGLTSQEDGLKPEGEDTKELPWPTRSPCRLYARHP